MNEFPAQIVDTLTLEDVAQEMLKCKLDYGKKIESIEDRLRDGAVRMDDLDATLLKHEKQRTSYNTEIKNLVTKVDAKLTSHASKLDKHVEEEMDKVDEMIDAIKGQAQAHIHMADAIGNLTIKLEETIKQTAENTGYIMSVQEDARMDKMKKKIIEEERERREAEEAPKKAVIEKVKMTAIGVVTTVVVGGMLSILWFGFKAYVMLHGGE